MRSLLGVVLLTACGGSPKQAAPATPPPPPPPPSETPVELEEKEHQAGILGSVKRDEGGAFASLTGTGDISSGFDDANIYGGLLGDDDSWWGDDGEMNGGFGYGKSGTGEGGTGWGTIGQGRYGTIGHGSGTGSGYGVGSGRLGTRGRSTQLPLTRLGVLNAVGDLDKAIIRRYIKRNMAKLSYCYEKELLAKPKLTGKLNVRFMIAGDGTVSSKLVTPSTKDLAVVAHCVETVVASIVFPKPKDGKVVQVEYPLDLAPATP